MPEFNPTATITSNGNGNGNGAKPKPYWERLQPVEKMFANADGKPTTHIRIFDDRKNVGQARPGIIVQFSSLFINDKDELKHGKVASVTFDAPERLGEIGEFLQEFVDQS